MYNKYNKYGVHMDTRRIKGQQIAQMCVIQKKDANQWVVPSQSGRGSYIVSYYGKDFKCNCPDYELRQQPCKHVYAVMTMVLKWIDKQGNENKITIEKKVYSQDWSKYDINQIQEKTKFMELLKDLCEEIPEPNQNTNGRPKTSYKDLVFASALKVYTQFSLRRFGSDLEIAKEKRYITHKACYASVGHFIQKEELTPILSRLITLSSLPLRGVESQFAVDSSGFRTTKFSDYCKEKHSTKQQHEWIKAHIITGVKTNIITGVEAEIGQGADSPKFIPLVNATANAGFVINEVSADKAYSSIANYNAVQEVGGQAYIPFKSNATGTVHSGNKARLWRRMFWYYQLKQKEFMKHYHLRSNVESTFFMLKAKFSDLIRSKTETAQINELLLKLLCHNIVIVNNEANLLNN